MLITLGIPDLSELLIIKGDNVSIGDPLFKTEVTDRVEVEITKPLNIKPRDIFSICTKTIGDQVYEGEPIAHKKTILSARTVTSPVAGSVISISHVLGSVTISTKGSQQDITPSFFSAAVKDIRSNIQEFVIDRPGEDFEIAPVQYDGGGAVFYEADTNSYLTNIGEEIKGKILIIKHIQSHTETKCDALGAAGIIYLEGQSQTDLHKWKVKNEGEFTKIISSKRSNVVISSKDKRGVMYD